MTEWTSAHGHQWASYNPEPSRPPWWRRLADYFGVT